MKLCKDCKYYKKPWYDLLNDPLCTHVLATRTHANLVSGRVTAMHKSCETVRMSYGLCSIDGKLFESKK